MDRNDFLKLKLMIEHDVDCTTRIDNETYAIRKGILYRQTDDCCLSRIDLSDLDLKDDENEVIVKENDFGALTMEDLRELKLPRNVIEDLCLQDYDDDQDLKDSGYVIGTLVYMDEEFMFIHGFPGDNPVGVIRNNSEYHHVGELISEATAADDHPLALWYDKITKGGRTYDEAWWYSRT
jgi:hypothetical protein